MFKKKITSAKIEKSADKSLSQPWCSHSNTFQYYLRDPAAKDNSITHAAAARSNLDAAITMRSAETDLRNTIELRATASEIASPKPDPDAKAKKKTILKHFWQGFWKGKLLAPKSRKSADKSISQPWCSHSNTFQYYLRDPAAKDSSIAHAAAARSNLDAAITMRSAETDLQNMLELRATASEIAAPKPDPDAKAKKRRFWNTFYKDFEKENC